MGEGGGGKIGAPGSVGRGDPSSNGTAIDAEVDGGAGECDAIHGELRRMRDSIGLGYAGIGMDVSQRERDEWGWGRIGLERGKEEDEQEKGGTEVRSRVRDGVHRVMGWLVPGTKPW